MKKILITIVPIALGILIGFIIDFPKDGFYIKNMSRSIPLIFAVNFVICLIVLYSNKVISAIVYAYNLFFIGIVVYIMLFIMNHTIYYYAPIEIFALIYTYIYARDKEKKTQVFIIMTMVLIAALLEGGLHYV